MRPRLAAAAVLVAPLLAALPASAARPAPCGVVITDPARDAGNLAGSNLDVVSGDITEGRNELYAVLRLAGDVGWIGDRVAGSSWRMSAVRNGVLVEFGYEKPAAGAPSWSWAKVGGEYVGHAGTMAGDLLLWKTPRWGALAKPRGAWSKAAAATMTGPLDADAATGKARKRVC